MPHKSLDVKEGIIIKDAGDDELDRLIPIYKKAFEKHNVFDRDREEVLKYLRKKNQQHSEKGGGFIIAKIREREDVVGGLLIRKTGEDRKNKHVNWRYNHIAVAEDYRDKGVGSALIEVADTKIKNMIRAGKINTAKIEIRVAENEIESLDFYKHNGFEIEGKLKSHYRYRELVYALGKEITGEAK